MSDSEKPPLRLTGYREILGTLGMEYSRKNCRLIRRLNQESDGPIALPEKGGRPKVDREMLLEWFVDNRLKSNGEDFPESTGLPFGRRNRARWKRTSTRVVPPPALLDFLTGMPNRRFLEGTLNAYLAELQRDGRPFGILFADVDKLQEVNDLLGYSAGDRVLKAVGATLQKNTRPYDIVGRAAGEEFLAIVANVTDQTLLAIAQKLCEAVERLEIRLPYEVARVTVSIGGALARPEDTKETLLKRAYRSMLQSKMLGRNQVAIATD